MIKHYIAQRLSGACGLDLDSTISVLERITTSNPATTCRIFANQIVDPCAFACDKVETKQKASIYYALTMASVYASLNAMAANFSEFALSQKQGEFGSGLSDKEWLELRLIRGYSKINTTYYSQLARAVQVLHKEAENMQPEMKSAAYSYIKQGIEALNLQDSCDQLLHDELCDRDFYFRVITYLDSHHEYLSEPPSPLEFVLQD